MDSPDRLMWLEIALNIAKRKGTCTRRNVGAVLVANGRLREIGWNGMERAVTHEWETCKGGACPRGQLTQLQQPHGFDYDNCIYVHAEVNAATNFRHAQGQRNVEGWARKFGVVIYLGGVSPDGYGIVPCKDCTEFAAWAGIELDWAGKELGWGNANA